MPLPSVRIVASGYQCFTEAASPAASVPWLHAYYEGLLAPFNMVLDHHRLENGKNNDFLTMARHVMTSLKTHCTFDDVGLFLMAHQTLDTHHPFRSTTTRLCRHFGIEAPAIALTEQEKTSPYIGLTILLAALRQETFSGSCLLLVLDQATLPYQGFRNGVDTAVILKLALASNNDGPSIDSRHYWVEGAANKPKWIMQCIHSFLDSHRLDLTGVHVVAEDNLSGILAAFVRPDSLSVTDARFMSCGGLLCAIDLLVRQSKHLLLTHMASDGHLYLTLFRQTTLAQ